MRACSSKKSTQVHRWCNQYCFYWGFRGHMTMSHKMPTKSHFVLGYSLKNPVYLWTHLMRTVWDMANNHFENRTTWAIRRSQSDNARYLSGNLQQSNIQVLANVLMFFLKQTQLNWLRQDRAAFWTSVLSRWLLY